MVTLIGKVTKVEDATINVSDEEFFSAINKKLNFQELVDLAWSKWLRGKGFWGDDVRIKELLSGRYTWEEYHDNGAHYSGYFSSNKECTLEDWQVYCAFKLIRNLKEIG